MSILLEHPNGVLWAYCFRDGTAASHFKAARPTHAGDAGDWAWAHFPLADQRARAYLARLEDLPSEARDALLGEDLSPRVTLSGAWTYGILPDFERNLEGAALDHGRLRFAFNDSQFLTARKHSLQVVEDVHRAFETGALHLASPTDAFVALVRRYCEVSEDQLDSDAERLDHVEDRVLLGGNLEGVELGPVRRNLSRRHRDVATLRTALARANVRHAETLSGHALGARLPLLAQHAEDLDREIVSLQDRARLIHEEIDTRINSATNKTLRALTIMSALLMPPTLIAGAFGMNLRGIPFASDANGFASVVGLCAFVTLVIYAGLVGLRVLK